MSKDSLGNGPSNIFDIIFLFGYLLVCVLLVLLCVIKLL
jgi:hypothetical protein